MTHGPFSVHDGKFEFIATFLAVDVEANNRTVAILMDSFRSWSEVADLKEVLLTLTAPGVFSLSVELMDMRMATGTVDFTANPKDPMITMTMTGWAVSEWIPDDVRDAIINAFVFLGLTGLDVDYTVPPP